jgi:hypothetical protein
MVRDLSVKGSRLEPFSRYALTRSLFGGFEKGGLRLAGHWERNRFEALPDGELDERLVEHERIPLRNVPQWRGKLPAGAGGSRSVKFSTADRPVLRRHARLHGRITSPGTETAYRQVLDAHATRHRQPRPADGQPRRHQAHARPLAAPEHPASRHAALTSFFDWAMEEGIRRDNPARQVPAPAAAPDSGLPPNPGGSRRDARASLPDQRTRWAIHLGICAGLRSASCAACAAGTSSGPASSTSARHRQARQGTLGPRHSATSHRSSPRSLERVGPTITSCPARRPAAAASAATRTGAPTRIAR